MSPFKKSAAEPTNINTESTSPRNLEMRLKRCLSQFVGPSDLLQYLKGTASYQERREKEDMVTLTGTEQLQGTECWV